MSTKLYELKLTAAMVISGKVARAGSVVQVDEATAKDFLRRGRAELVSAPAADDQAEEVDLGKLTKAQLEELAEQMGLDVSGMNKADILAAIEAASE